MSLEFRSNFQRVADENAQTGDKRWTLYADTQTVTGTPIERYKRYVSQHLEGEETFLDVISRKNEQDKCVSIDFFGPGVIYKYLDVDAAYACTLEDRWSGVEKVLRPLHHLTMVPGDYNYQESFDRLRSQMKHGKASSIFFFPFGGRTGVPVGFTGEYLRHYYMIAKNLYECLSQNGGSLFSILQLVDTYKPHMRLKILQSWLEKLTATTGLRVDYTVHAQRSEIELRIRKFPQAPQELPPLTFSTYQEAKAFVMKVCHRS